jgi:predicted dehydrogenase
MIDMARWLVDDIVRVSAQLGVFVDRPGADGGPIDPANDSAFLLTEFANGAHGMIHASPIAHVADRSMQQQVMLYGEEGSLELDVQYEGAEAGVVLHAARAQEEQMQRLEVPAGYWGGVSWAQAWDVFTQQSASCRSFVDAILEDSPATPNFYHGYKAQQVIEAALEADRSGNWVTIKNPT